MTTADIRKGDLVKATSKGDPSLVVQGRVRQVGAVVEFEPLLYITGNKYDFEILDRPLPPIDEELLTEATHVYRVAADLVDSGGPRLSPEHYGYRKSITAVINFVREYDSHNNKQGANA